MCGRFARYQPLSAWLEPLGITASSDLLAPDMPRYNIAPGTRTWVAAASEDGQPQIVEQLWHFPTTRGNRINVRSETAHRIPEYQPHFDGQRCLVFANGFYEPKGGKGAKNRPWYFFRPSDDSPLFLGGIIGNGGFSILTSVPASPVAPIHDRSPVIIAADHVRSWLNPELPGRTVLQQCASTHVGETLDGWHVNDAAKNPGNDGADLLSPPAQGELF